MTVKLAVGLLPVGGIEAVLMMKSFRSLNPALLSFLLSACETGGELKYLEFPKQVKTYAITNEAAESKFSVPSGLQFRVHENPVILDNKLILVSELQNEGEEYSLIVHPYGGEHPYGGTSPFRTAFSQSSEHIIRYTGTLYPPEPPLPMEIIVPARSSISFRSEIPLESYTWEETPEVSVDWAFYYFKEPYPKGTMKVILPKK